MRHPKDDENVNVYMGYMTTMRGRGFPKFSNLPRMQDQGFRHLIVDWRAPSGPSKDRTGPGHRRKHRHGNTSTGCAGLAVGGATLGGRATGFHLWQA